MVHYSLLALEPRIGLRVAYTERRQKHFEYLRPRDGCFYTSCRNLRLIECFR